jgi:hypothetical protein
MLIFVLAAFPLIAIVRYIQSLADTGAEVIAAETRGVLINIPLARIIFRTAVAVMSLLAVVMVVNLFLPRIPAVPYLPFLNFGITFIFTIYLVWKSVGAYYQRVENLLRERLLGGDTETEGAGAAGDRH